MNPNVTQHEKNQQNVAAGKVTQEAVNVMENGVHAKGVVLEAKPTGNIVNGYSEFELHIRVTRPDGSMYDVTVKKGVPQYSLGYTAVGSIVQVYYMPDNEQNIFLGYTS